MAKMQTLVADAKAAEIKKQKDMWVRAEAKLMAREAAAKASGKSLASSSSSSAAAASSVVAARASAGQKRKQPSMFELKPGFGMPSSLDRAQPHQAQHPQQRAQAAAMSFADRVQAQAEHTETAEFDPDDNEAFTPERMMRMPQPFNFARSLVVTLPNRDSEAQSRERRGMKEIISSTRTPI
jgi:hypothetical protein